MTEQIKNVAERLRGIREIEGISSATLSKEIGIDVNLYEQYESGNVDIPVSFLYEIANKFNIELVALLTGEEPKLHIYSHVKSGEGLDAKRSKQYNYKNLAFKMLHKKAEPFLVTVECNDLSEIPLDSHPGQELEYVLEGNLQMSINGKILTLSEGDTVYYNSKYPHGFKAIGGKPAKLLSIIIA